MVSQVSTTECAECGMEGSHWVLWVDSLADGILMRTPFLLSRPYRRVMEWMEKVVSHLGSIAFKIGYSFGIVTFSKDSSLAMSDRSRLLLEEGLRQTIDVSLIVIAGKPTDIFYVKHGKVREFFKSLPLLPEASALRMDDKVLFKDQMRDAGIPVPKSFSARTYSEAKSALAQLDIVCVKPRTGSNGRHTFPYVKTEDELHTAFTSVKRIAPFVTVEEYLEGDLCRATCIDGHMYGFLQSAYPAITGNGHSTISELIEEANRNKLEGVCDITLNPVTIGFIKRKGYSTETILEEGQKVSLTYRGGTGNGGSNYEHGRNIHPSFIPIIEKAAKETGLTIVGFDIIVPDPQKPEDAQKWGFIEANSLPWIDLHAHPYSGTPIDLSKPVWELWRATHQA